MWVTEWTRYLGVWLTEWLTDWLVDWMADWLTDWFVNWLTDWLTGCVADTWLTGCMIDTWLTGWMCGWMHGWLTGWLTPDWLIDWVTDWVADSLTHPLPTHSAITYPSTHSPLTPPLLTAHLPTHSLATPHPHIHPLTTHTLTHSFTRPLSHPPTHSPLTHLLTHSLTSWTRVPLQTHSICISTPSCLHSVELQHLPLRSQEAKTLPVVPALSQVNLIYTSPISFKTHFNMTISFLWGIKRYLFPSCFATKILSVFVFSSICATCPAHHIVLDMATWIIIRNSTNQCTYKCVSLLCYEWHSLLHVSVTYCSCMAKPADTKAHCHHICNKQHINRQFSTSNFISISYFNIDFKPFI
jgi:hypothetical protein